MSKFEKYLKEAGFKPQTVYQHRKYASYFLAWMAEKSLDIAQITYTDPGLCRPLKKREYKHQSY